MSGIKESWSSFGKSYLLDVEDISTAMSPRDRVLTTSSRKEPNKVPK